jgi:hypothetical protein
LGDLTGGIGSPAGRVRRQIRRPQLRHPATQRSDRIGQLIRSAITVAGIRGNADNNSPTRGSYPSTSDPDRTYLGGPSLANAAFTVFREQPINRAISEIDTACDLCSRRISAQSSDTAH